jgi:hypothetical protein
MDFYAVLDNVVALLRQRGRTSYRALKIQFQLDDEQLEALAEGFLPFEARCSPYHQQSALYPLIDVVHW